MAIQPITGTDTVAYIQDTAGNKASANIVIPVNADGTAMGGGSATSPSIAGGEYNSTLPTLTNGQTDALQLSSTGKLLVALTSSTGGTEATTSTAAADGANTSNGRLLVSSVGYVFNGSTLDRQRGDTTGTFVKANPLSGTDRSVTATTTSAQLMAANTTRTKFFIKNDTAIVVWINMGATAVAAAGSGNIAIAANGGYFEFTGYSGAVNIIAASTTAAVTAREF